MLRPMILCLALVCPAALSANIDEKYEDQAGLISPDEGGRNCEENRLEMFAIQLSIMELAQKSSDVFAKHMTNQLIKDMSKSALISILNNLANIK